MKGLQWLCPFLPGSANLPRASEQPHSYCLLLVSSSSSLIFPCVNQPCTAGAKEKGYSVTGSLVQTERGRWGCEGAGVVLVVVAGNDGR